MVTGLVVGFVAGLLAAVLLLEARKRREVEAARRRVLAEADREVARAGRQIQELEARCRDLTEVLPVVPDVLRQMLSAPGRRAVLPFVVKLMDQAFHPTQCAVFLARPENKLGLGEGKGLPDTLTRGQELDAMQGRLGHVAQTRRAMDEADFAAATATEKRQMESGARDMRVEVAAPIEAEGHLLGVIALGGVRQRHGDEKRLLKMVADLTGLAMIHVDKLRAVQHAADIDGLTGTFNKRFLHRKLGDEIHRVEREHGFLSLLILDIDHFKTYNDSHGHIAGDEVLKKVGHILKASVREDDVVARYGGEEFVVLYPGATKALAYRLAQALRHSVESHAFPHGGRQPLGAITISGGVASFPEDAQSAVELLRAADEALYEAKGAGRNRIIGANPNYLT